MRKQILTALLLSGSLIVLLGVAKYVQISRAIAEHSRFLPPPEAVTSIVTTEESWPRTLFAVGTLSASQGVMLSSQEPGMVTRIGFESGKRVKAGDMLLEQDTSVEEANLKAALASAEEQQLVLGRTRSLRTRNAASQADLETAQAKAREAEATVESLRATIARKKTTAPFAGITGIRQVNLGQYLAPGTPVVPLHSLDPLYVNFSLPQQRIADLRIGESVKVFVDAFPDEVFSGTLTAINPEVDSSTRNLGLQATLPNAEEKLRPGMFARISVVLPEKERVIAIPASSVLYAPYGHSVYLIESMNGPNGQYLGVRSQVVKLGARQGDRVVVMEGLTAGQQVVTSGSFKLRPGAAVAVNNSVTPSNELQPRPADT